MEWNEYLSQLLNSDRNFDNLTISLDGGTTVTDIPPIIKSSILMLDRMVEHQGQRNILVFPEKTQSIFIFTLMKLFHNISQGKIKNTYDPSGFAAGERLKVGNAIAEYLGLEERNGNTCLILKLADLEKYSAPLTYMPVFQKVSTKRRLSKFAQFIQAFYKEKEALGLDGSEKLSDVAKMKTHLDSSIYAVTSVASALEQLRECKIGGRKVTDSFFIGKADYEGTVSGIGPGQLSGVPAIVFASDLYAVVAANENGYPIQSIIIDGSNSNALLKQLDALDELLGLDIPIVCITDIANSFELNEFVIRGFNIWRWNDTSITDQLYDAVELSSDRRIKNCANHSVEYLKARGGEITDAIKLLSPHRKETETASPQIMKLFEKLSNLTFGALRATVPFTDIENELARTTLKECLQLLENEARFLPGNTVSDYENVIIALLKVYTSGYIFKKTEMMKECLKKYPGKKIVLVIAERSSKPHTQRYWDKWCKDNCPTTSVIVMYPAEYYAGVSHDIDITVASGWLKRAIMRRIIYSFSTSNYIVLLYDYESRWQAHDVGRWKKALSTHKNKIIIEKALSSKDLTISTTRFEEPDVPIGTNEPDELGEIEKVLRENKYRQYTGSGGHGRSEIVPAIPVNFVGGFFAFYRTGHKIVSATKVIMEDSRKIEIKLPSELSVGDFIVVRKSDRDLIREIADIMLKESGLEGARETASKWREVLKIELLFSTEDEFIEKLKKAGCDKSTATIKGWIDDEDMIAPSAKEDLRIIAEVAENETLLEMLDKVHDAAQNVRKAHQQSGKKLSEQLRLTIAERLKDFEDIDPYNIWAPIDMDVEGIGNVKILKIIDIGAEMQVDASGTNQLIEE